MTTPSAEQFLSGSNALAAKFPEIGATITGQVVGEPKVTQQTKMDGTPDTWPGGDPKYQLVVTLQTDQRDDTDDDGKRTLYIKGRMINAVRDAVGATGAKGLEAGGTLTVTYVADGQATQRGFNPPKIYSAQYARPDAAAASSDFLGLNQPAAAKQHSPETLAALKAAGIDPASVPVQ